MIIQEAIVHRFAKERYQAAIAQLRETILPVDNNLENLLTGIQDVFNKTLTRGYGSFTPETPSPFSELLHQYLSANQNLAIFTLALANFYKQTIDTAPLATGGYLFFARYQDNAHDYLFVVALKLKSGTGIDDTHLVINKTINLDIEHLHEAARLNLTAWQAGNENYITFIKKNRSGENNSSATHYFRTFLGVTELTETLEQTKLLLQVVRDYCETLKLDADNAREIRQTLHTYCVECTKAKKGISLDALSVRLNDQKPDQFAEFIANNEVPLSDDFIPNSRIYRNLRRYLIKDAKLTIDFEESILGTRVIYDESNETLIILDLPAEFKQRLTTNGQQ